MKMQDLISIIVPYYNSEKFFAECIESIIGQTYKNLEIILVDDGSTDGSTKIADEFARSDGRIKIIHQKNQGQTKAREKGFIKSKGAYVAFIDSDDTVDKDFIKELYMAISLAGVDLAVSALVCSDHSVVANARKSNGKTHVENNVVKLFFQNYYTKQGRGVVLQALPTKLFRRRALEEIDSSHIKTSILEDNIIMAQVIARIRNGQIAVVDKDLYFYRIHDGSTMTKALAQKIDYDGKKLDYIEVFYRVMDEVKKIFAKNPKIEEYVNKIENEEMFNLSKLATDQAIHIKWLNTVVKDLKDRSEIYASKINSLNKTIDDISRSRSYRVGHAISKPLTFIKNMTSTKEKK